MILTNHQEEKHQSKTELYQNELTQIDATAVSKRENSSINLIEELPQNDRQIIIINKIQESKNSLSANKKLTEIEIYLRTLKPFKKRKSELKAFESLKKEFSENEINKCFLHVMSEGVSSQKEKPHSPMAYLGAAITEILETLTKKEKNQTTEAARKEREAAQAKEDEKEHQLILVRNRLFSEAFPSVEVQSQIINKFASTVPMLNPEGPIVRNLAIEAWWHKNQNLNKKTI